MLGVKYFPNIMWITFFVVETIINHNKLIYFTVTMTNTWLNVFLLNYSSLGLSSRDSARWRRGSRQVYSARYSPERIVFLKTEYLKKRFLNHLHKLYSLGLGDIRRVMLLISYSPLWRSSSNGWVLDALELREYLRNERCDFLNYRDCWSAFEWKEVN